MVASRNSSIKFMLDQDDDPYLDDEWLTANEQLTHFRKAREKIVGRVKGSESPSVQGPQYSEEDLVVRDRVPISTERPSVRKPGTNGNHALIGQYQNNGSNYSQETPVSMDNLSHDWTEDQPITSPNGEALGIHVHVRCSERIINSSQWYNP